MSNLESSQRKEKINELGFINFFEDHWKIEERLLSEDRQDR